MDHLQHSPKNPHRPSRETVLLVDDEEQIRNVLSQKLASEGYHVLMAGSGQEALKLSQEHTGPIHLLLTDVLMPNMNGCTLAARLTSARPDTKILYISAYSPSTTVHFSLLDPETAFLPKPFTMEMLISTIRTILDAKEAGRGGD